MRSNHDLDSKTPRQNRQGFTPHEPTHSLPHPTTLVKTITERRTAPGGEGPILGIVPPHCILCMDSLSLNPSSSLQCWTSNLWKFLERELRECWGSVCINICWGLSWADASYALDCFIYWDEDKEPPDGTATKSLIMYVNTLWTYSATVFFVQTEFERCIWKCF